MPVGGLSGGLNGWREVGCLGSNTWCLLVHAPPCFDRAAVVYASFTLFAEHSNRQDAGHRVLLFQPSKSGVVGTGRVSPSPRKDCTRRKPPSGRLPHVRAGRCGQTLAASPDKHGLHESLSSDTAAPARRPHQHADPVLSAFAHTCPHEAAARAAARATCSFMFSFSFFERKCQGMTGQGGMLGMRL